VILMQVKITQNSVFILVAELGLEATVF
jgi:hypothetical protein